MELPTNQRDATARAAGEALTSMAELVAMLARRMSVLAAAGHAAGLLGPPSTAVPERLAQHVRYYTGIMRRQPESGPLAETVLLRFAQAGRDMARMESALSSDDDVEDLLGDLRDHERYLRSLPDLFEPFGPLQQLVTPRAPDAESQAPAPPARPASPALTVPRATGRLPAGTRPLAGGTRPFPENQQLLDRGLQQIRWLETKMLVVRAACAIATDTGPGPMALLVPAAREAAHALAADLRGDDETLLQLRRFVDQYQNTRKLFDQRPLKDPEGAKAALEVLVAVTTEMAALPALAKLLERR